MVYNIVMADTVLVLCQTPDLQTFVSVFHSCSLSPDMEYVDVIERVLTEKEFWAREVLSELLQASLVPSKSVAVL